VEQPVGIFQLIFLFPAMALFFQISLAINKSWKFVSVKKSAMVVSATTFSDQPTQVERGLR
jgi:hypothetical protein